MFAFVESLVLNTGAYGAIGFFLGAFFEEVITPIPSPLLLIGAAFFFGKPLSAFLIGKILLKVILPISLGATLGSLVIYGLAYKGGKGVIDKYHRWLKFSWDDMEKFRLKLSKRKSDEWILFLSRCLPFTPTTLITAVAGVIRMNVWSYSLITFVGIFIRVSALFIGALVFGDTFFK